MNFMSSSYGQTPGKLLTGRILASGKLKHVSQQQRKKKVSGKT